MSVQMSPSRPSPEPSEESPLRRPRVAQEPRPHLYRIADVGGAHRRHHGDLPAAVGIYGVMSIAEAVTNYLKSHPFSACLLPLHHKG